MGNCTESRQTRKYARRRWKKYVLFIARYSSLIFIQRADHDLLLTGTVCWFIVEVDKDPLCAKVSLVTRR